MFRGQFASIAFTAALPLAVIAGLGTASAAPVTISATAPTWSNVVGGSNINFDTSGGGNNTVTQVFWGRPASFFGGQSGLGFDPSAPATSVVQTETAFQLGTLYHYNAPIEGGTAASSARLNLSTTITDAAPSTLAYSYQFLIDETPNQGPCAYQTTSGNPCADAITFNNMATSPSFAIGGASYTFQLLGFSSDGGSTIRNSFVSQEGTTNSIGLYAKIIAPTPQQTAIPEPASLVLLGAGLLGLATALRRRQS